MALPQITWQDVQQMPDDGNRYEAIGGALYMTPAPSVRHQRISIRLERALFEMLEKPGLGELFHAPIGVEFPVTGEGVQPDILFVGEERKGIVATNWLQGAPDLVIEILSLSTGHRDRGVKRQLYERQGVGQYWIVDPEAETVEVWTFDQGVSHARQAGALPVRFGGEPRGEIDLKEIFRHEP